MNTIQLHIQNTQAAISAWENVPPETVMRNLSFFRIGSRDGNAPSCGSPACFGGWLPYFDHFAKLGVISDRSGAPRFAGRLDQTADDVSLLLFGCLMFEPSYEDHETDHQVVMDRLLDNLDTLNSLLG